LEKRIENSIVSAIREIAKIVDSLSHQKQANLTQQQQQIHIQSKSCSEKIQIFIPEPEWSNIRTSQKKIDVNVTNNRQHHRESSTYTLLSTNNKFK